MKNISDQDVESFIRACHRVGSGCLARCSSGNLSMRVGGDRMLVKASRSWMEKLTRQDISLCRISDGHWLEGKKPSVETGFHAGILKARSDVNVVLHFQTPYATALACQETGKINFNVIPEIPFYIGPVARIPFFLPGSAELAEAVTDALRDHDLVIMANHGQTTVARDVDHLIQNAEFFELACSIIVRAGKRLVPLSERDVRAILAARKEAKAGV